MKIIRKFKLFVINIVFIKKFLSSFLRKKYKSNLKLLCLLALFDPPHPIFVQNFCTEPPSPGRGKDGEERKNFFIRR